MNAGEFELLVAPPSDGPGQGWFAEIVGLLLNRTSFIIAGQRHRFMELEFCDPLQSLPSRAVASLAGMTPK